MHLQIVGPAEVLDRNEAAMRGLSRFYTGRPCRAGHLAQRYVANKQCVVCNAEIARRKARRDPPKRMFRNVLRRTRMVLPNSVPADLALGCNRYELQSWLEAKFRPGMCWEKYGQWEVDHTVSLASARTPKQLVTLCHWTNLQPLWKRENRAKGGAEPCPTSTKTLRTKPRIEWWNQHLPSGWIDAGSLQVI